MFELASVFLFLLASLVLVAFVNSEMRDYALQESRARSRLILDRNLAIHEYFNNQLKPRLFKRLDRSTSHDPSYFDPVWMSSTYAVREINRIFSVNGKGNESLYYKEAAVSARSPENEADAHERDFLDALRSDESLNEWSGVREIDGRPYFQTLVRGESMEAPCLRCHGDPENAPGELVDQYGSKRSFDRFEGQLVSALSVRIPLGAAYDHADALSRTLYGAIAGVLLVLFLIQRLLIRRMILQPLNSIRNKVVQIAHDESKLGERLGRFATREFNDVAAAFNSLSTNLKHGRDTLEIRVDQRTDELREANRLLKADILKREAVENALRESSEFNASIVNSLRDAMIVLDAKDHRILLANQVFLEENGYTDEQDVLGRSCHEVIHGCSHADRNCSLQKSIESGEVVVQECKDCWKGRVRFKEIIAFPIKNAENQIHKIIHISRDITRRKLAQKEQELLLMAISQIQDMVIITDSGGIIEYVNPAFTQVTGYELEDVNGKEARTIGAEEQNSSVYKEIWQTISQGGSWSGRILNKRKDGSRYTEEATVSPIFSEDGVIISYVAVARDITAKIATEARRQQLEQQISQKHKMEALGVLAGGIAHNFNNNLSVILGAAELMHMKKGCTPGNKELVDKIRIATLRSRDLVSQLMAYTRQRERNANTFSLAQVTQETKKLLQNTIPSSINTHLEISAGAENTLIHGDEGQIQECLLNLCNNAVYAMNERGDLNIALTSATLQESDIPAQYSARARNYLKLSVADTGCGMDSDTQKRAFDLFFTTKGVNEGTGIGLSTVQGIVQSHNGLIKLHSAVGKGSRFELYFPIPAQDDDTHKQAKEPGVPSPPLALNKNKRVLLVDDDADVAKVSAEMLAALGCKTTILTSSREALAVFTANADRFDLLMTDKTMPFMSGIELIESIRKVVPHLPAILCTGYSSKLEGKTATELGIDALLYKPIDLDTLSHTLEHIRSKREANF